MARADPAEPFFVLKLGSWTWLCSMDEVLPDNYDFVNQTDKSRLDAKAELPAGLRSGGRFFDAGSGGSTSPEKRIAGESTGGSASHFGHALPEGDTCAEFNAAVHSGRMLEAQRLLQALSGNEESLDKRLVERVRRVTSQHEHARSVMDREIETFEVYETVEELRVTFGFEMVGDIVRIVYYTHEPDLELVRCCALSQERDLHTLFNKSFHGAVQLGEVYPNDCVWNTRSVSKTIGQKFDNLAMSSSIDALDEANEVWAIQYWPPPGPNAWDDKLPPVEDQHVRVPYSLWAMRMSPTTEANCLVGRSKGYTVRCFVEAKLPPLAAKLTSFVPSFLTRKLVRDKVCKELVQFRGIIESSPELAERIQNSPRTPFYELLRKRLL